MDESQMLKGILEGCILSIIAQDETYGYDILNVLDNSGFVDIGEGTLYPILTRLEKKGYLQCRIGESPYGPKRKYFSITDLGIKKLTEWKAQYEKITASAEHIIRRDDR